MRLRPQDDATVHGALLVTFGAWRMYLHIADREFFPPLLRLDTLRLDAWPAWALPHAEATVEHYAGLFDRWKVVPVATCPECGHGITRRAPDIEDSRVYELVDGPDLA